MTTKYEIELDTAGPFTILRIIECKDDEKMLIWSYAASEGPSPSIDEIIDILRKRRLYPEGFDTAFLTSAQVATLRKMIDRATPICDWFYCQEHKTTATGKQCSRFYKSPRACKMVEIYRKEPSIKLLPPKEE